MRVNDYVKRLELSGIHNAEQEALWLISEALGVNHAYILSHDDFSPDELAKIEALISRRESGEPLQYILGQAEFYGYDFAVGSGVLIPRHDTETIIEAVKEYMPRESSFWFLDWGTGSGCIAITILMEFRNSYAFMLDESPYALSYARENLERYNLTERAELIDELDAGNFDVIVSNPPYIPSCEIAGLMRTVRDYEPLTALDGGTDGMKYYRQILSLSLSVLKHKGYIIFEAGNIDQVEALKNFSSDFMFEREFFDAGNFPRCIVMRRSD